MYGKMKTAALGAFALLWAGIALAAIPDEISSLVIEMKETGSSVRGGVSKNLGVYLVGIGRSRYRPGAINRCREVARLNAMKELASALQMSIKAKDTVSLRLNADNDKASAEAFLSSLTESSVDRLLKGVQVVSSGPNGSGEMEVVVCVTSKLVDQGHALLNAQMEWGDKGVVMAVGVDEDRSVAEKNALRSAVEQVAGTLVVGKVSVNEQEELHKRLATTAGALVEEYRVVKELKVERQYRLEILARVDKRKLYESFRSYFKCLGNPAFCIVAADEALLNHFTQFFVDKGFSLVNDPSKCQYLIKLDGRFRERPTPGNAASEGTMLELAIQVVSQDGTKTLLTMNERQAKDSEVLTCEQRRVEIARRIFKKLEPRLHRAVQDMVVRMLDEADSQPKREIESGTTL